MSILAVLETLTSWETRRVRALVDALNGGVDAERRRELVHELDEIIQLDDMDSFLGPLKLRLLMVVVELDYLQWKQREWRLATWAFEAVAEREAELEAELHVVRRSDGAGYNPMRSSRAELEKLCQLDADGHEEVEE